MIKLECPHRIPKTNGFSFRFCSYAHAKRVGPSLLTEAFNMWRFKEGQFIDESVAAGVAH